MRGLKLRRVVSSDAAADAQGHRYTHAMRLRPLLFVVVALLSWPPATAVEARPLQRRLGKALGATKQAFVGRYLGPDGRGKQRHLVEVERVVHGKLARGRQRLLVRSPSGKSVLRAKERFVGLVNQRGQLAWVAFRFRHRARKSLPFARAPLDVRDFDPRMDELATPALLTLSQLEAFFAGKPLRYELRGKLYFRSPRDGRVRPSKITLRLAHRLRVPTGSPRATDGSTKGTSTTLRGLPTLAGLPPQPIATFVGVSGIAHFTLQYRARRPRPLTLAAVCTGGLDPSGALEARELKSPSGNVHRVYVSQDVPAYYFAAPKVVAIAARGQRPQLKALAATIDVYDDLFYPNLPVQILLEPSSGKSKKGDALACRLRYRSTTLLRR